MAPKDPPPMFWFILAICVALFAFSIYRKVDEIIQNEATHEKTVQEKKMDYMEILALIENLRLEIHLMNKSANLANEKSSKFVNRSDWLVAMELVKGEFHEQMKWTEDKFKLLDADSDKTIDTMKSTVDRLSKTYSTMSKEFETLFKSLRNIDVENERMNLTLMQHIENLEQRMNLTLMQHIKHLDAETEKMNTKMREIEKELASVSDKLNSIGIDVTMRVLPNTFNKGHAVLAIFITFLLTVGGIFYVYCKYKVLSKSLDELRKTSSSWLKQY